MSRSAGSTKLRWVLALALMQALAVGAYLWIEASRDHGEHQAALAYERVDGREAAALVFERPGGPALWLSELRGKPVLLHFWATWCPPCREELPLLLAATRQLSREGRLTLIAVSVDDDWDVVREFFDGEVPPEVFRDTNGQATARYEVSVLPDTYLLDPSGISLLRLRGARDWSTQTVQELLERMASGF